MTTKKKKKSGRGNGSGKRERERISCRPFYLPLFACLLLSAALNLMPLIRGKERKRGNPKESTEELAPDGGKRKGIENCHLNSERESSSWMHSILFSLSFWLKWQIVDGRLEYFTFTSTFAAVLASAAAEQTDQSIGLLAKAVEYLVRRWKNDPKKVEKTWHTSKRVNINMHSCRSVDCSTQNKIQQNEHSMFYFNFLAKVWSMVYCLLAGLECSSVQFSWGEWLTDLVVVVVVVKALLFSVFWFFLVSV